MDEILRLVLSICVLMIIYSLVESVVGKTKNAVYVKNVMTVLVIIISVDFFYGFDLNDSAAFDISEFEVDNASVWDNTVTYVEDSLELQMTDLITVNGLNVDNINVSVTTDYSEFEIEKIFITGPDATAAKNLISGHFGIAIAYINTE